MFTPEEQMNLAQPVIEQVEEPKVRGTMEKAALVEACKKLLDPETLAEYTDDEIFRNIQAAVEDQARTNFDLISVTSRKMIQARLARSVGVRVNQDPRNIGSQPAPGGIASHIGDTTPRQKRRG